MIPNYPTFTLEHEIYDQVLKIVNVNANKNKKKQPNESVERCNENIRLLMFVDGLLHL